MKIIIAGAGAVGTHLSRLLSKEKQDIVLIDEDHDKLGKMESYLDIMTVNVPPTSITGLKNAGVGNTDLFVAVTPDESRNMTACMLTGTASTGMILLREIDGSYRTPASENLVYQSLPANGGNSEGAHSSCSVQRCVNHRPSSARNLWNWDATSHIT